MEKQVPVCTESGKQWWMINRLVHVGILLTEGTHSTCRWTASPQPHYLRVLPHAFSHKHTILLCELVSVLSLSLWADVCLSLFSVWAAVFSSSRGVQYGMNQLAGTISQILHRLNEIFISNRRDGQSTFDLLEESFRQVLLPLSTVSVSERSPLMSGAVYWWLVQFNDGWCSLLIALHVHTCIYI